MDSLPLEDEAALNAAVEAQLRRLEEDERHRSNIKKKRATALAMAQVGLTIASREEVFKRPDCVTKRIYNDRNRDWAHDPLYRSVEEVLKRLYRKWSRLGTARAATEEFVEREAELRETEWNLSRDLTKLALAMVKTTHMEIEGNGEDGKPIVIKPARWTFDTVPRLADAASKLGRLALGMTPGGRQEVEMSWRDGLPAGVTPEQAEQVKIMLARALAAAAEGGDEDEDEDGE